MKTGRIFATAIASSLLLAGFVAGQRTTVNVAAQSRAHWEYQVIKADRIERDAAGASEIKDLKRLGDAGWEAIARNDSWVLLRRTQ